VRSVRTLLLVLLFVRATASTYYVDPAGSNANEKLFANRSGAAKKEAALSFVGTALQLTDAVANRQIIDDAKFKDGLSKVIDGTVECLNASIWAPKPGATASS
jgi:hypothetical protein